MDSSAGTSGEVLDGRSQKRPRPELDAGAPPWADLHPDILGIVLRLLPCLADRASARSACRQWRAGARGHVLPPPLPLLVLPPFRFSSLSPTGTLTLLRRVPGVPEEAAGGDRVRFVGSSDAWLVGVTPSKNRSEFYRDGDGGCFLLNALSHEVVRLPHPCTLDYSSSGYSLKILPVVNGSYNVHFRVNDRLIMSFHQVVLSAPPGSGSKYLVAASSYYHAGAQKLALWRPGMMSWNICSGFDISAPVDLAFYQGKLYMLGISFARMYTFELEDDEHGVIVTRVEHCVTQPLPSHPIHYSKSCNMVVWRGNLLLIIRYYNSFYFYASRVALKVEVFAVDFSTNPKGLIKVHNFDGDCMFISSSGCKSFPTSLHAGVEGDLIYFVPDYCNFYDRFVYNMRDGSMKPFADKLLPCNSQEFNFDFPVWLFPSE